MEQWIHNWGLLKYNPDTYGTKDTLHPCSVYHNSDAQNHSTINIALISNAKFICNYARCWVSQAVPRLHPEGKVL